MLIRVFAPGNFFEAAFFNTLTQDVSIDVVSATATEVVVRNPSTGVTTTITGTGLPLSAAAFALNPTGTITGFTVRDGGGATIAAITNVNWPLPTFVGAIIAEIENGNSFPLNLLLNAQPITYDASASTGGVETFIDGASVPVTIIGSRFGDTIEGGAGNDTINAGGTVLGQGDVLIASAGNDTYDFAAVQPGDGYTEMVYSFLPGTGITATIDGGTNTGSIVSSLGTNTLLNIANALNGNTDGFDLYGTMQNDQFTINGGADTFMRIAAGEGVDSYALTLTGDIRVIFGYSWGQGATQGAVINLATGVIANDGFGNAETITFVQAGGRLQIEGTDLADNITGSAANEVFILRGGNDTLDGGDGYDLLRYDRNAMTTGVTVDLQTGVATGSWGGVAFTQSLSGLEEVRGTNAFGDILRGSGADELLDGRGGNDSLFGGAGSDVLYGGDGDDVLNPGDNTGYDEIGTGAGNDTVRFTDLVDGYVELVHRSLSAGIAVVIDAVANTGSINKGVNGTTTLIDVANPINAGAGPFGGLEINGTDFNDSFTITNSANGYMELRGGRGADTFIGVGNVDGVRLSYNFNDVTNGIVMNLGTGIVSNDGYGFVDTLSVTGPARFNQIRATQYADVILGSAVGRESYILQGGSDTLNGGGGYDIVRYDRSEVGAVNVDLAALTASGAWAGVAFINRLVDIDEVRGSNTGNDTISGDAGANRFLGRGGNDSLNGRGGNDTLEGEAGNDTLLGDLGNDTLYGGADNDFVAGGDGNDELYGDDGNDQIYLGLGNDFAAGGLGSDAIYGGAGTNRIFGGVGADSVYGGTGADEIYGGGGGDARNLLYGNDGNDLITAGAGGDLVAGGTGNDTLYGGIGNDQIYLGLGNDLAGGGLGNDAIYGGSGTNRIFGGVGADSVYGGTDGDEIYGGGAGDARNLLYGNDGNDLITAGSGGDLVAGGSGNDTLYGGTGNDQIYLGLGNDFAGGGAGNDLLVGGAGANQMFGGIGNDTLQGGTGRDVMSGGPGGIDVFVFASAAAAGIGAGRDVITDFTLGVDDIDLRGLGLSFTAGGFVGGGARQVRSIAGFVIGDVNGDGVADFAIEFSNGVTLQAGDFLL